ncbi:MAG: TolC family protein [Bacillota bacterium]
MRRVGISALLCCVLTLGLAGVARAGDEIPEYTLSDVKMRAIISSPAMRLADARVKQAYLAYRQASEMADAVVPEAVTSYETAQIKYLRPFEALTYYLIALRAKTATEQQIWFAAEQAYYSLLKAREWQEFAERAKDRMQSKTKLVREMYEAGLVPENDLHQAVLAEREAGMNASSAATAVRMAKMALNRLMGMPLTHDFELLGSLPEREDPKAPSEMEALALSRRFEVYQAERMVELKQLDRDLASEYPSNYMPLLPAAPGEGEIPEDPLLFLQWLREYLSGVTPRDNPYSLPMAEAALDEAYANLAMVTEDVRLDVYLAYERLEEAKAKMEMYFASAREAERRLKLTEVTYISGFCTYHDVSMAELSLAQSEAAYLDAVFQYRLALAEYEYLTSYSKKASGADSRGR